MPDNIEARRAQLQHAINLIRRGWHLFSQALDILEWLTQGQQDPNFEEQG